MRKGVVFFIVKAVPNEKNKVRKIIEHERYAVAELNPGFPEGDFFVRYYGNADRSDIENAARGLEKHDEVEGVMIITQAKLQ